MADDVTDYGRGGTGWRSHAPVFGRRDFISKSSKLAVGGAAAWALGRTLWPSTARAQVGSGPPFDFSDAFYSKNGIDPSKILKRVDGTPPDSTIDTSNTNPDFNDVRILKTTGGFNRDGNVLYYVVNGALMLNSFTPDAAGQTAFHVATTSPAYLFPKAAGNPLGDEVTNRRQDNVFIIDYTDPLNPLGLWIPTFPRYTPAALNTHAGQAALSLLAAKNGLDLDGTPIIKKVSEIQDLQKAGFLELLTRPFDGSLGPPWVI